MKKILTNKLLAILVLALTLLVACTENIADIRLDPKLSTSEILGVASSEATVIGFVVAEGDGFSERGVCYDIAAEPTIDDNKVVFDETVTGATFSVTLAGLDFATQYYARAYAINDNGTIYGEEMTFTTLPVGPTVLTTAITDSSYTTATGGGDVTADGGSAVTARGLCYSITTNPTITDSKTTDGDGLGVFTSSLSGLDNGTMYYVRAYASNNTGTSYGAEVSFTTLVPLTRTWNIPGGYVEASYPGSTYANWAPDKAPMIISVLSAPNNLEGYVNMAAGTNDWKVATTTSWDDTNYGGVAGVLDVSSPNISNGDGYYKINVDADALTYTALATTWGVIGDATPLGWGGNTPLAYQPELMKWTGAVAMTDASFKFRSNDSWDAPNPNYGSTAGDETLNEGGDNISLVTAGDYAITLDLSQPMAYTYRADMWGLIGSATPGEWATDSDLTWDAGNGVFTVTVDLIAGEIKFRANNDWDYALGGDIGTLSSSGGNIAVSIAGNYTITLDPWNMVGTITMN